MTVRVTGWALVASATYILACGERERHAVPAPTPLEREIAREMTRAFGIPVTTRCATVFAMPVLCETALPDGGSIATWIHYRAGAWEWSTAGLVITTDTIVEYIRAELTQIGVDDAVICVPRIRRVDPGDWIECTLGRGGKAFVSLQPDGGIGELELALDPAAAAARSERVSTERAEALTKMSRALEHTEDEEEDSEPPGDAGGVDAADARH